MKKRVLGLAIVLLLGCGAVRHLPEYADEKRPESSASGQHLQQPTNTKNVLSIKVTEHQIFEGPLLLVNKEHPVPPGIHASAAVKLDQHRELVKGFGLSDRSIRMFPDLARQFSIMVAAAEDEGVRHFLINSGYRDEKEQAQLYRQMGPEYAMPPGYSEHNLGLSLDIGSTQAEMNRSDEGKWLKDNAWKYGFILRYPPDKTAITGIRYEPWHFRYVGLPHSAIMQEKQFVLEQYLDYLKERQTITAVFNRQTYEISYYPVSGETTVQVPAGSRYEISGNNVDGIIVTVQGGEHEDDYDTDRG